MNLEQQLTVLHEQWGETSLEDLDPLAMYEAVGWLLAGVPAAGLKPDSDVLT